jgi:hypothetical protein
MNKLAILGLSLSLVGAAALPLKAGTMPTEIELQLQTVAASESVDADIFTRNADLVSDVNTVTIPTQTTIAATIPTEIEIPRQTAAAPEPVDPDIFTRDAEQVPDANAVTIPAQTAIFVTLTSTEQIDAGGKQAQPLILTVTQPVFDNTGQIAIPVGSKIDGRLIPMRKEKMVFLSAERLILGSQVVPIQAQSDPMPSEKIVIKSKGEMIQEGCQLGSRIIPGAAFVLGEGNSRDMIAGTLGGTGLGCLIPIFFRPHVLDQATLQAGKEYLLISEQEVAFSQDLLSVHMAHLGNQQPIFQAETDSITAQYENAVNQAIAAYQSGSLSRNDARQLLAHADEQAMNQLPAVHPSPELRRQVNQLFDYTYIVDR